MTQHLYSRNQTVSCFLTDSCTVQFASSVLYCLMSLFEEGHWAPVTISQSTLDLKWFLSGQNWAAIFQVFERSLLAITVAGNLWDTTVSDQTNHEALWRMNSVLRVERRSILQAAVAVCELCSQRLASCFSARSGKSYVTEVGQLHNARMGMQMNIEISSSV